MVAGVEHVPEEGLACFGDVFDALFDALGDDFRGDELGEGLDLRVEAVAEWVVEVEGDDEVGHDDGLAHVDFEVVEIRDRDVVESERGDLVVAGAPVSDGGGVVAIL